MAKISRLIRLIKFNNYHSHFAVEVLLLIIMVITATGNFFMDSESSVLSAVLKTNPALNQKLLDVYESHVEIASAPSGLPAARQVLAASTVSKPTVVKTATSALPDLAGSALLKPNPAESTSLPHKDIEIYQVRSGDTVARIAASYGVDTRTIISENQLSASGAVKAGQELRILPTSGVKHTVKNGETLQAIAKKYNVGLEDILDYNEIEVEDLILPGDEIIIPNGTVPLPATPQRQQYLADVRREDYQKVNVPADYAGSGTDFIWPLPGVRRMSQYYWSGHKGIDIPCNNCQVVAAADGIVEIAGWQKGYGYTILLNHGKGYQTRYGHAWSLQVTAGDHVTKGQPIMLSGSTGRSTGPHLHFETRHNGAYLNPLNFIHP